MLIIGLIGSLSSGKHLIADILHKQYDFIILEYKDFKKKKDDVTKECLSKAKKTCPKNVAIIGIDSLKVMNEMNDNPQFFPVAIEGPLILRFQRQKLSGSCLRHRVGCIIASTDQRIIATGYNGTPENIKACKSINRKFFSR